MQRRFSVWRCNISSSVNNTAYMTTSMLTTAKTVGKIYARI